MNLTKNSITVRILLAAALLALVYFSANRPGNLPLPQNSPATAERPRKIFEEETAPAANDDEIEVPSVAKLAPPVDQVGRGETSSALTRIEVTPRAEIRDESGRIVFRGEVNLRPTLERIEAGDRLRFRNDGSVFQNREGRLPRRPQGYYHEFVHPTPHLDGPGPQRIVKGAEGEFFYSPDHYRTFERLDKPPPKSRQP